MIKHFMAVVIFCMFAIAANSTIWLYDEPDYLQTGSQFASPFFMATNMSAFEIIHAPYFPLLEENLYTSIGIIKQNPAVKINSSGKAGFIPPYTDFSGSFENNLEYAMSSSSFRIGQASGSSTLNAPWVVR